MALPDNLKSISRMSYDLLWKRDDYKKKHQSSSGSMIMKGLYPDINIGWGRACLLDHNIELLQQLLDDPVYKDRVNEIILSEIDYYDRILKDNE